MLTDLEMPENFEEVITFQQSFSAFSIVIGFNHVKLVVKLPYESLRKEYLFYLCLH